jgi:hypothetical protein
MHAYILHDYRKYENCVPPLARELRKGYQSNSIVVSLLCSFTPLKMQVQELVNHYRGLK